MKGSTLAIIGIILTALGIITPIVYSEFKNHSELEIKNENSVTIITKPSDIDDLEIFYKKQQVSNLKKGIFKITNKSKTSVVKEDFINPLKIALSKNAKIISFNVEEEYPNNLSSIIKIDSTNHSLHVAFELMNPDDYLVLGILYTGDITDIKTSARIKGINNITYREVDEKINTIPSLIVFIVLVLSSLFILLVNYEKKNSLIGINKLKTISYDQINKEDLIKEATSLLHHISDKPPNSIEDKIEDIFGNDEIKSEDKTKESLLLISNRLSENYILNKKAALVINLLRLIGVIYLVIWIITVGNNVYSLW